MTMPFPGIDIAPVEPSVKLSAGARRTARQRAAIALGRHPFGSRLANNGKTCGECYFAVAVQHGSWKGWKCERYRTSMSEASDLRRSWPACNQYSATKPEDHESRYPDQYHGGPQ